MKDLKERAIRGTLARVCAQAANLMLRVTSLAILARLLEPKDFGLVGMVAALTGVLNLFRDFGLSAATVQHVRVTEEQTTTLFWINVLVGILLATAASGLAPVVAAFYHEPRLYWVTIIMASTFVFNAAGIQHSARLQRQMRFTTLSVIDTGSWVVSTAVAIGAAKAGFGYWALVAMAVTLPLSSTTAFWMSTAWVPRMPSRRAGVGSMMRFGGTMTVTGIIVYFASNFEKVLLGRFWGADAIGIYGRAYQLIRIPTDILNGAIGEVAFSALSRLQDEPRRLRSYFLKGYSLVLSLTLPATVACGVFAPDLIGFVLGPKWKDAATIFRLLTPTILVFAIANPLAWLLNAIGMVGRGVKMSLVIAPLMIGSYLLGLPYGPKGVACAYSAIMILWLVPVVAWSVHHTVISFRDILVTVSRPLASSVVAGTVAFGVCSVYGQSHLARLIVGGFVLTTIYSTTILYVMGQKSFYADLLQKFIRRSAVEEKALASAQ
ncbi:MAG TPA: lipopolysaccharide biosynthesis protein [Candidatus Sulfotelmatobacter sp.]|nr:lipopolysaccharide biosynthesis protein [Candidatus Sulfotelmatobacter sp.]